MLLDPFEKEFNLPAIFVEKRDRRGKRSITCANTNESINTWQFEMKGLYTPQYRLNPHY